MIIFKSIRYKNFLSSGNTFTDINFRKSKSTLVVGHNGAGKSTMLDALSFGLFGKPHRKIMKSQLVNSINQRQAVVEVEFSIGKSNFKIVHKPPTEEIKQFGFMNMRLKMFAKFDSWGLIEKRVEKESKCPFNFMRN